MEKRKREHFPTSLALVSVSTNCFLFFFLFIHRKEKKRKYKEIELQTKPIILKSIWEDIIRMKRNKGQRGGSIIEIMEKKTKQMDYRGGL